MRIRPVILTVIIVTTVLLVAWRTALKVGRMNETPAARAHRLCEGCGLTVEETDVLIATMRTTDMDRAGTIRLWASTYEDDKKLAQAREECMPCVEAVLDAAETTAVNGRKRYNQKETS